MVDEATEIISDISHADFDRGSVETNGCDLQSHPVFLIGERVFDKSSDLRSCRVAAFNMGWHRPPLWFLAMDMTDQAIASRP